MDFQHILVGLDVTESGAELTSGSRLAYRHAVALADQVGARVDLVHSTAGDRYVEQGAHTFRLVHEGLPDRAQAEMLELVAERGRAGHDTRLLVRKEKPWVAISEEAKDSGSDLIVLGKHNEEETGARIGSVAKKVIHGAPCSVWVVRPGGPPIPHRVLAAVDTSEVGATVLAVAAALSKLEHAELHVAHAWQVSMEAQLARSEAAGGAEELQAKARTHMERLLSEAGLSDAELHLACSAPYHFIGELAAKLNPDLVVMGTVSRSGLPGWLLGNTAERMLANLSCSLLTVKP